MLRAVRDLEAGRATNRGDPVLHELLYEGLTKPLANANEDSVVSVGSRKRRMSVGPGKRYELCETLAAFRNNHFSWLR